MSKLANIFHGSLEDYVHYQLLINDTKERNHFFLLTSVAFGYEVVLVIDSGPGLDILVKVFQYGVNQTARPV